MSRPLVLWWWERYRARSNTALTRHCLVMRSRVQVEKGRPLGARQLVCTAWKAWIWRGQKDFALYDQVIEYIFGSQMRDQIKSNPSSKNPHFENEARCTTFSVWKWVLFAWEWKMISISKAEHLPSFWNRGPGELGNGLLYPLPYIDKTCKLALHLRKDWREDSVIYPKRNCSFCSENGWIRNSDYQKRVFFVIWLLSTIKRLKHWNFVQSSTI